MCMPCGPTSVIAFVVVVAVCIKPCPAPKSVSLSKAVLSHGHRLYLSFGICTKVFKLALSSKGVPIRSVFFIF